MTIAFDDRSGLVGTDDGGGDNNLSLRQVYKAAALTAVTGNQGQITIYWGTANAASAADGHVIFDLTYFGQGAEPSAPGGTTGPTFTGNQVQVKWGGAAGLNGILGASFTGVISANVLTVSALTGTMVPGSQVISGVGVNAILGSQITGTPGSTGTYNLVNANVSSEAMTGTGFSVSDVFTLGENFDATHIYVFAADTHASGALHNTTDSHTNVDGWFITTAAGTIASQSNPTGTWSGTANLNGMLAELVITGSADGIVTRGRKILQPGQGASRGLQAIRAFPQPVSAAIWLPQAGGRDVERLPPIGRPPDEATPFFRPSPVPVPSPAPPKTGEDVERLPPIARAPDEPPGPFFRPSPVPVFPFVVARTGEDIERLPPIPRSPDEAIPFFRPSQFPVPFRVPPKTGGDVERLPPIPRSPDEAIPFFRPSPVPVFPFVVARTGEDVERLPPIQRSPDEPPGPFFRPSPIPVPSTIWFTPYDQPPLIRSTPVDQQGFIRPPAAVTIAGMAWYNWQDRERLPPQARSPDENFAWFTRSPVPVPSIYWFATYDQPPLIRPTPVDQQYFITPPPAVVIPISGMAWFNPPDTRLPPVIGDPEAVQTYPPFIEPPLVPFYAQSNADDFNPLPVLVPGDGLAARIVLSPTVTVGVSGIAWYNFQHPNPFAVSMGDAEEGTAHWMLLPPVRAGISGIAWYNFAHPNPFPVITGSVEEGTTHWVPAIPPPPPLVTELHFLPFFATPGKLKAF